jgi:hypothetical protein
MMSISQLSLRHVEIEIAEGQEGQECQEWRECQGSQRCEVCGSTEMQVDEVQSGGRLLLAECDRCDHRFTARVGSSRIAGIESARDSHPEMQAISEADASWSQSSARAEVATAA